MGQLGCYDGGNGDDEGEAVNTSSTSPVATQVVAASAAITTGAAWVSYLPSPPLPLPPPAASSPSTVAAHPLSKSHP